MKKFIVLCTTIVLLFIFDSCQKEEFVNEPIAEGQREEVGFKEGQMILGEQLKNPYSVENMQIAYENLQSENKLKSNIKIGTTHLYVRFRPKSMQELDLITRDTTLDFFDYPLDVEIKRGGTSYHDPEIPKNEITWQYTVVPVDYTFPKVQYQKLANLFLPEDGGELQELKSAEIDHFDWLKLETEAMRITNNLKDAGMGENTLKSTSWRPSGTIRVWDDIIDSYSSTIKVFDHWQYYNCQTGEILEDPEDEPIPLKSVLPPDEVEICQRAIYRYESSTTNSHFIPLEGIEVRARIWFTTHKGYTDANGNFTCDGTFNNDANYSIKWERWDFDIKDEWDNQAYYNGPKQTGNWNLNIAQAGTPKSYLFAHIFRAAHTYYYKNSQWGIKPPPDRSWLSLRLGQRLHIAGRDFRGTSHYFDFNVLFQTAQVVIYSSVKAANGSTVNYDSRDIFGTTIHELAHASHWEIGFNDIHWLWDKCMTESWAIGVETVITNDVYGTNDYERGQNWTIAVMTSGDWDGYTCIVWDMIDDNNQHGTSSLYPNDQVFGYTLSQIEDALPNTLGSWWTWRENIKDRYANSTESNLDILFQELN